jgi:hypothetical protein
MESSRGSETLGIGKVRTMTGRLTPAGRIDRPDVKEGNRK